MRGYRHVEGEGFRWVRVGMSAREGALALLFVGAVVLGVTISWGLQAPEEDFGLTNFLVLMPAFPLLLGGFLLGASRGRRCRIVAGPRRVELDEHYLIADRHTIAREAIDRIEAVRIQRNDLETTVSEAPSDG